MLSILFRDLKLSKIANLSGNENYDKTSKQFFALKSASLFNVLEFLEYLKHRSYTKEQVEIIKI